jgi:hypothetical protein
VNRSSETWIVRLVLAAWFVLALAGSLLGAFDSGGNPPAALGVAAAAPVIVFAIACAAWAGLRRLVMAASPRLLTLAQSFRVVGLIFVILYFSGVLPASFALPAGLGDLAIGVTAPLVARMLARNPARLGSATFIGWNLLGMLDLVTAVTTGILSSNSPLGILAHGPSTEAMGRFPLSLIPTFFVPLFLILHLIALAQARRSRRSATDEPTHLGAIRAA